MKAEPTLKAIADQCGVSVHTVSNILGSRPDLHGDETRAKVLAQAREMGYERRRRGVRRARAVSMVGLVQVGPSDTEVSSALWSGLREELEKHHLRLMQLRMDEAAFDRGAPTARYLRDFGIDALVVHTGIERVEGWDDFLRKEGFPAIWLNRFHPHDSVFPEDLSGAYLATNRLLDLGHKRICYAQYHPVNDARAREKFMGYALALKERDLVPSLVAVPPETATGETVGFWKDWWLREEPRPTAFLAHGLRTAGPLCVGAGRAGVRVPDDFSLIYFDASQPGGNGLGMTTLALDEYEQGAVAAALMLEKIHASLKPVHSRRIKYRLDESGSCGRV